MEVLYSFSEEENEKFSFTVIDFRITVRSSLQAMATQTLADICGVKRAFKRRLGRDSNDQTHKESEIFRNRVF